MSNADEERDNFMCHVFVQWLANRRILDQWLTHTLSSEGVYAYRLEHGIKGAFNWKNTPEGYEYWEQKSNEWEKVNDNAKSMENLRPFINF